MPSIETLQEQYDAIRRDAERLAGGLNDLAQRATVYHHLFEHSGRNHVFPLIAAHGAMWARGYFRYGLNLGRCCSWKYAFSPHVRQQRLAQLDAFADAFRDINRRVCIDTYTSYHFTERFGDDPQAGQFVPPKLLAQLRGCHAARRENRELAVSEKREMFKTFFLNEQETIVGPSIAAATQEFDWPLMKAIALRPVIRFAYFGSRRPLFFRNFANRNVRIKNGLTAFDTATRVGLDAVEASLAHYRLLPEPFFANSAHYFSTLRQSVLVGG